MHLSPPPEELRALASPMHGQDTSQVRCAHPSKQPPLKANLRCRVPPGLAGQLPQLAGDAEVSVYVTHTSRNERESGMLQATLPFLADIQPEQGIHLEKNEATDGAHAL